MAINVFALWVHFTRKLKVTFFQNLNCTYYTRTWFVRKYGNSSLKV